MEAFPELSIWDHLQKTWDPHVPLPLRGEFKVCISQGVSNITPIRQPTSRSVSKYGSTNSDSI
jgi:hypothetical protein